MRKIFALIVALLVSSPALADWTGKNAAGATVTFKNPNDCTSVVCVPQAQLFDGTNSVTLTTAGGDAVSNTLTGVPTYARMQTYNGTTWDRWRGAVSIASGGVASGAIASGAFASGSVSSGAIASGAVASGAIASGALAVGAGTDGWDVTQGAKADSVCATDTGTCSVAALLKKIAANLTTVNTTAGASVAAGTNIIGKVGIDQTTPGTTNAVSATNLPTTVDTNSGNKSASTPRTVLATDQLALAAWGQGATGAAAPAGATQMGVVQGGATGGFLKAPISCDNHVFKHITTATDTLAVQGVTSQTIYICAWRSRAAGTATWYLENTASTNANCASTLTQLTGVASEVANSGEVFAPGFWNGLKNTVSNGLCINSTGTGGVDIDIWYAQF